MLKKGSAKQGMVSMALAGDDAGQRFGAAPASLPLPWRVTAKL
jgi:hypothetical protein